MINKSEVVRLISLDYSYLCTLILFTDRRPLSLGMYLERVLDIFIIALAFFSTKMIQGGEKVGKNVCQAEIFFTPLTVSVSSYPLWTDTGLVSSDKSHKGSIH